MRTRLTLKQPLAVVAGYVRSLCSVAALIPDTALSPQQTLNLLFVSTSNLVIIPWLVCFTDDLFWNSIESYQDAPYQHLYAATPRFTRFNSHTFGTRHTRCEVSDP